mgnify:FL=1
MYYRDGYGNFGIFERVYEYSALHFEFSLKSLYYVFFSTKFTLVTLTLCKSNELYCLPVSLRWESHTALYTNFQNTTSLAPGYLKELTDFLTWTYVYTLLLEMCFFI